jgi:beta-glucosidase-like glycosyl hydrolase/CubicO group peptidase (beta-lactamase class C family)
MFKKVLLSLIIVIPFAFNVSGQSAKNQWVDSVFNNMNLDEKIGQLFMVPVFTNKNSEYITEIEERIKSHHVGGLIFMQGGPVRQVNLTNRLQNISTVPLLIAQDAEWGLGATLDSTIIFPKAISLGALQNDSLIYYMAKEIAREMKLLGAHLNFAPVADVNENPDNRINYRSFGSNRFKVASKAVAFTRGLQDNGIMACAKHFTLNSLTIMDIRKGIPVAMPTADSLNIYPFQKLFENNLTGVMPASSDFPLLYHQKKLSKKNKLSANAMTSIFTGEWLKKQMHYDGLIFVDIPGMQSTTNRYRNGEAEMFAFQAGNDILLSSKNIGPAIRKIKKLLKKQKEYNEQLNYTVKKILAVKYDAGLDKKSTLSTDDLVSLLNTPEAKLLNQKLQEAAITVVSNSKKAIPVRILENKHFTYIASDSSILSNEFYHYLKKYVSPSFKFLKDKNTTIEITSSFGKDEIIIAGIFPQTPKPVMEKLLPLLKQLAVSHEVIICDFGYPDFIKGADSFSSFITTYVSSKEMLKLVPQTIFGSLQASGQLPYSPSPTLKEGTGFNTAILNRFGYSIPEDAHMNGETLEGIDSIANEAIRIGATPGCHVLVAHEGKVIYEKSFGYLTYDKKNPVTDETIYDLASVTKVSATLQAIMFLYEKDMIDINKKISVYLPELKESNKRDFTVKDILTHQAGLWPFLPFWAQTMKNSEYMPEFYSKTRTDQYPLVVADSLYASASMRDSLWSWIIKSKIREKPTRTPFDYKYSDMGFYILQHVAEKLLNQPLEDFIQQNLYEPLGSTTTGYLPLQRFLRKQIAPTEDDKLFRKSLLVGTVHDQGAAMHGGVAGHAGLFSDANDLAKLGQMLLQQGSYGGYQYYKPETVRTFTQKQFVTSRRGLGWDKPIPNDHNSPTSLYASPDTFGHTGFTGTCIWVDPEFDLVYVFLSNRVHPDMTNNKLMSANIRPRIQDVIYKSIFNYCVSKH